MASAAASESILFVGALLAAGLVAGTLSAVAAHYATNLKARSVQLEGEMQSRVALVNDPLHVPNGPVVLYVKNTGLRAEDAAHFVVLLDGVAQTAWTLAIDGGPGPDLPPGHLAAVTLTGVTLAPGDHAAAVVTASDYQARLAFTV